MDEEFSDAEIRTLLRKVASDRRQHEILQRLERTAQPKLQIQDGPARETPDLTSPAQRAA